ncbi:MAG TPA: 50S ribosomal protein L24 [Candidatus Hydrogenedentes bacterium]|nr:50S ribosomal protein L24 [Candidatus Hydrogenedentota bacterium]HOJ67836.1 50S ribosomal protein L24 [Candidatus Hydrogenedentota bacterium]HOK88823.1 50S ribosomal protein L24 [Candidatus Hydrogenedentota bacterium]HOV60659.1 50S ribosomal protein L24 [Candidatus Hydrogenedentota bacterium]HPO30930.1 50S ribosomal protein L24 [Candidatus Hydrogenedentota bacterium]
MHIRKKDIVVVISGADKGRRGRVLQVYPRTNRVLVEGVNMIRRHTRPTRRNQSGGIVEKEAPVHISNVMPWCAAANKPSKIVMKRLEDGSRIRVWKINGEAVD